MQDHDLQKIWVTAFDKEQAGGEFSLLDERTGERKHILSTFPQALGVAIRYREPFLLERDALLSSNADFVDRMVINPKGEGQRSYFWGKCFRVHAGFGVCTGSRFCWSEMCGSCRMRTLLIGW